MDGRVGESWGGEDVLLSVQWVIYRDSHSSLTGTQRPAGGNVRGTPGQISIELVVLQVDRPPYTSVDRPASKTRLEVRRPEKVLVHGSLSVLDP